MTVKQAALTKFEALREQFHWLSLTVLNSWQYFLQMERKIGLDLLLQYQVLIPDSVRINPALASRTPAVFLLTADAVSLRRPLFPATPSPPRLPSRPAGPGEGRKPVINRRSRGTIWGKMGTFRGRLKTSGVTR